MNNKRVWMGVDLGNARIGISLSDSDLLLAHPEDYIAVYGDYFYALDDVVDIIREHNVERVVVGYPLELDGYEGKSAKKAKRWSASLSRKIASEEINDVDIILRDERLSSVAAHNQLLDAGFSMRKHKTRVDSQAAVILLQSALDERMRNNQKDNQT